MSNEVGEVKKEEHWTKSYWRPAMGWSYMVICLFDFMLAPVFFGILSAVTKMPMIAWKSLTLAEGGLFHLAMGAVLGISAFGRTQEKTAKISADADVPTPVPTPAPRKKPEVLE
jgi:hypothetical protein